MLDAPLPVTFSAGATTAVLIRATELDARVASFAAAIAEASGHTVAYLIDERSRPQARDGRLIVGVSRARCAALGLYCPPDFEWSCGDYGYCLARHMLPQIDRFWMIEHDVRFAGESPADFFAFFAAQQEIDLLTTYLRAAENSWYWMRSVSARGVTAQRCFFPVTRLSALAIDTICRKRRRHSRQLLRRLVWPNDEAMVATTLVDAGLNCRDINSFGRTFYATDHFSYDNVIDGDTVAWSRGPTRLYHPVLYGEQYAAKLRRLADEKTKPAMHCRRLPRVVARVNGLKSW